MASMDQLKQTFFDECTEALQQIEAGLTDIRQGHSSDDTVNAVFRAVHSVKGGAGIFGFESLVEFAHVFETVLDGVRRGSLTATADTVDVLLAASDVLSDLVQMSRSGEAIPPGFGGESRSALEQIVQRDQGGESGAGDDGSPAPAEFEGIDFKPVPADGFDFKPVPADGFDFVPLPAGADASSAGAGTQRSYTIAFRPKAEMLKKANEPLYIIRELRKLGELELIAETDSLPSLADLVPDRPYIGWTGTLRTSATRAQIDEVFEFVVGDCDLEIVEAAATSAIASTIENSGAPESVLQQAVVVAVQPATAAEPAASPGKANETAEPAAANRSPTAKPAATTTRIELERIDRVVNMVGELVIAQAMLGQIVQDIPEATSGRLLQVLEEVVHHTRELKDSVMSMRAQPVGAVFQRMPRLVRELAAKTAKKVRLEMFGETTEVDRSIIERLGDPLTHIIRNSVDHGIESPADRLAAGKSEEGTVRLAAEHRGGRIVIEVSDDGGGINSERVLKKAREKGLISPDAALSDDEINNLIMLPGFSTAETISDISGRGVGMDVVRSNIQDIGGRISLKSERGRGMTIQLALPLTLAVMDGMVIKVGREIYVMPLSAIVECLRPTRSDINNLVGTCGMLQLRGDLLPLVNLGDLLDIASVAGDSNESVVIITDAGEGSRFGLVVDELCGHQQVVIKSIEESYGAVPGIAAATILGNGRVAFILDIEKLSDLAASSSSSAGRSRNAA
jgi:two-component system, chemotaxis family, sensor kinase CheA